MLYKKVFLVLTCMSLLLSIVGCSDNSNVPNSAVSNEEASLNESSKDDPTNQSKVNTEGTSEESSELIYFEGIDVETNIPDPLVVGYEKIRNPFSRRAADPYVMKHEEKYYYCYVAGDSIYVSCFDSLKEITKEGASCVFSPPDVPNSYSNNIWAPEIHFIDGHWYIYYAGDDGENINHRMYVLRSKSDDPMGEYEFCGQVTDSTDKWAIDGSIFEYNDQLYFIWSGWPGDVDVAQYIYIAKMDSPTMISGDRVCISTPTRSWEIQGGSPMVNEGPVALIDGEYLTIIYSASGSWCDDYCLGQLLFCGGDVLNPDNWIKNPEPILKKNPAYFFGPGHCSIAPDENGVLWMIFHANEESGTGWAGRSGWMYPIRVKENGVIEVVLY